MLVNDKVKNKKIKEKFNKNAYEWKGIAFLLPSMIGVGIFYFVPYVDVLRRSFVSVSGSGFTGLRNIESVLLNQSFKLAFQNTGKFMLVCIPLLLIISLFFALILKELTPSVGFLKTGFLLPMGIPVASVVLFWKVFFGRSGLLNHILEAFGIGGIDWMNSSSAFGVLVFSYIWKNLGYNIILWLAGLSIIPNQIYEAAKMDGANKRARFIFITLPNLKSSIFIIAVMAIINSFKVFREAYLISGNYPHESMYMLQHIFNNWFRNLSIDKLAAGAFLVSMVFLSLIGILYKSYGKGVE